MQELQQIFCPGYLPVENAANLSISSRRACPANPIYCRMICFHRQKRRLLQSYQSELTTEKVPPTQLFSRIRSFQDVYMNKTLTTELMNITLIYGPYLIYTYIFYCTKTSIENYYPFLFFPYLSNSTEALLKVVPKNILASWLLCVPYCLTEEIKDVKQFEMNCVKRRHLHTVI